MNTAQIRYGGKKSHNPISVLNTIIICVTLRINRIVAKETVMKEMILKTDFGIRFLRLISYIHFVNLKQQFSVCLP